MNNFRKLFLTFISLFLVFNSLKLNNLRSQENANKNLEKKYPSKSNQLLSHNSFLIDDFEKEGNWVVKYSQFRNFKWDKNSKGKDYEDSNSWIKWLDKKDYPNLNLFPYEVVDQFQKTKFLRNQNKILALRGKWEYLNSNWVALEPANIRYAQEISQNKIEVITDPETKKPKDRYWDKNDPNFIWIPTHVEDLSIYVWSGNYNYILEAHFQDTLGKNYIVPVSSLRYKGWKNLRIRIPDQLSKNQKSSSVPEAQNIKFIRFMIRSDNIHRNAYYTGREANDIPLHLYFDHFFAHIEDLENFYFGYDLQFFNKFWDENKKNISQTETQENETTN